MKEIFKLWWAEKDRVFVITNYKKSWKEIGNPPLFRFRSNGAKKKNGDKCLDVSLVIGYTEFNYINFNLQKD